MIKYCFLFGLAWFLAPGPVNADVGSADLNGDGVVNISDWQIFANQFGASKGDSNYVAPISMTDFNHLFDIANTLIHDFQEAESKIDRLLKAKPIVHSIHPEIFDYGSGHINAVRERQDHVTLRTPLNSVHLHPFGRDNRKAEIGLYTFIPYLLYVNGIEGMHGGIHVLGGDTYIMQSEGIDYLYFNLKLENSWPVGEANHTHLGNEAQLNFIAIRR